MNPSSYDKSFYVSQLKGYADYHLMKRETYEHIGKYREDLSFTPNAESDYMERSYTMGYRRAMPIIPVSIINENCYNLITPVMIKDLLKIKELFKKPVCNEIMTKFCLDGKFIK